MDEHVMPDWLLKAAQETGAMVRKYQPLLKDAQRHAEEIRRAMAAVGPVVPAPELGQVMKAGLQELLVAYRQQSVLVYAQAVTASATVYSPTVVLSEAGAGTDSLTVIVKDSRSGLAVRIDAMTIFLAILWVLTLALPPVVVLELPIEAQAIIAGYLQAVNFTLMIHWRVSDNRNRKRD